MTAGTATTTLPRPAARLAGASAGRLPVDGVVGAEEALHLHLGAPNDPFEDEGGLRARRREALLHRLELDRQRRRRRTA